MSGSIARIASSEEQRRQTEGVAFRESLEKRRGRRGDGKPSSTGCTERQSGAEGKAGGEAGDAGRSRPTN